MDKHEALRRLHGGGAAFRSVQEDALSAIVEGVHRIVVVMPTGAGKSTLFMIPAAQGYSGTTVVLVPLVALRDDLQRRCDEKAISCRVWRPEGGLAAGATSVLLATVESALQPQFLDHLHSL